MKCGLLPLTQTAMTICNEVAYHEYEGIALNLDERARLVQDIGNKKLMILRNHGTLATGSSIPECFMRLYNIERSCSMQVRAMIGGELHLPSKQSMNTAAKQGADLLNRGKLGSLAWPALLRMLDRMGASYKD